MIRTKCYSVANKVLIAFFAFTGITLQTGLWKGEFDLGIFRMFTNISNLICGIYFIFAAAVIATDKRRTGGHSPFPLFKGICTMSITLTGIVASAVIASEFDPHTSSELSIDDIVAMCDDLIEAHKGWLPEYK